MTRAIRSFAALLAAAAFAFVAAPVAAQGDAMRLTELGGADFPNRSYALHLPGDRVVEPAAVTVRENGREVDDLVVVPAAALGQRERGVALLLDASESMRGEPVANATVAARAFAARRRPGQQMAVVAFNARTQVVQPFTLDAAELERALAQAPRVAYWTRMHDALLEVVGMVREARLSSASIVLLSDGQELGSEATLADATAAAREAGVRVFVVGLRSRFFDAGTLRSLAADTGGQYLEASSSAALPAIFDALGAQLAGEHLIQYRSLAGPGERVEVTVTVEGFAGAADTGYVTPQLPQAAAEPFHHSAFGEALRSRLAMVLVALGLGALVGLGTVAVLRPRHATVGSRVAAFVSAPRPAADRRRRRPALETRLSDDAERSLERTRWWGRFKDDVELADVNVPPLRILLWTLGLTVLAGWLLPLVTQTGAAVVVAFGVPFAVLGWVRRRVQRKRALFAEQLPDNLEVLASALRAGHSLAGALAVMASECNEPARSEFQRVLADERLGAALDVALATAVRRMASKDLDQVAVVAALQRQAGGSAAEVLDRVVETVRERQSVRRLVRTLTSQGRLSGWIVSLLPVALLAAMSLLNWDYVSPLYVDPVGRALLIGVGAMVVTGFFVIRRIVDIRV